MNNELENKLKSLTDLAKNFGFGKEEAVKLAKNLISEYKISFADLYPDMSARFEEVKELCGKIQKPQTASTKNRNPQRNLGA